jgi:ketosteroid isomerase-like protein
MESRSGTLATNSDGSFHKPLTIPTAERWAKSMKAGGGITVPHFVETTELSPTIVYARYYVEGLVGGRDAPYRTRVTDVWVKEKDGKWRMKAGHFSRLRTHSQNRTVAARATADRKTVGHLS